MDINWITQSRLFELARRGRRLTHILAVIPLVLLFSFIAGLAVLPVFIAQGMLYGFSEDLLFMEGIPPTQSGIFMALRLISSFVLIYVFVGLWAFFFEGRPFWTLGYELKNALWRYLRGFLLGVVMFGASILFLLAFGAVSTERGDPAQSGAAALLGVLVVLSGWIVQGGAEELLVRGWALPVIGARIRPWVGVLVSSLLFAAMHGLNPGLSVLALVNLALFAVFAALFALREGSLWGISALHSAWNWVQGNIFGFAVSGTPAGGGTLLDLATGGPQWLSGGDFGPEGGLGVTVVFLVGIAAVLLWPRKQGDRQAEES
jgi:membrane protease YdiL (CAAX protease family)